MTLKRPFLDYEPVSRPSTSKSSAAKVDSDTGFGEQDSTPVSGKSRSVSTASSEDLSKPSILDKTDPTSPSDLYKESDGRNKLRNTYSRAQDEKIEVTEVKEKWILKRGHTISFAGLFLFTALVFFRPYELFPSLSWLSSAAFWIALATISAYVLTQLGLEGAITVRLREVNLIFLLLITGALSIPLALEPTRAFFSFVEFQKVVLIFIVLVNVVRTEKRLNQIWILILIATCVLSLGAINDYRLNRFALQGVRIKGMIGGLFDNPNDLALHLVTMMPIALALFLKSRNPLTKVIFLMMVILILAGVVTTFSRGGFVALMATALVLLWKVAGRSRWLLAPLVILLVVLFVVFAPHGYGTRVSTTSDESAVARIDDMKRSLFIAVRHPIFGVGMDNYILFSNLNKATHNAYTQVAAEMGAAAAVFYLLFIIAPFKGLRRVEREAFELKSKRRFYYAAIALQASLAGYMVASFFASVAYLWYIYYLVAYSVCLRRIYDSSVARDVAELSNPNDLTPLRARFDPTLDDNFRKSSSSE